MTKKIILGLIFFIMTASVSACASPETRHDDAAMNKDASTNKDEQTQFIIGGYTKIEVGGVVK